MNLKNSNGALKIAQTYFEAMAGQNVDKIMTLVSEDIICNSPVGQLADFKRGSLG